MGGYGFQPAEHLEQVFDMWLHRVVLPWRNVLVRASVTTTIGYRAVMSCNHADLLIPRSPVLARTMNEYDAFSFTSIGVRERRTVHLYTSNVRGKVVHAWLPSP